MNRVYENVSGFVRGLRSLAGKGSRPDVVIGTRMMPGRCGFREYVVYSAEATTCDGKISLEVCCGELNGGVVDRITASAVADVHQRIQTVCAEIGMYIIIKKTEPETAAASSI